MFNIINFHLRYLFKLGTCSFLMQMLFVMEWERFYLQKLLELFTLKKLAHLKSFIVNNSRDCTHKNALHDKYRHDYLCADFSPILYVLFFPDYYVSFSVEIGGWKHGIFYQGRMVKGDDFITVRHFFKKQIWWPIWRS